MMAGRLVRAGVSGDPALSSLALFSHQENDG